MLNNNIGYCCINMSLNIGKSKKSQITPNRGMTKNTFGKKGLEYVSELSIKNIDDLFTILKWNKDNNILVYRMSSDMFPCLGFYKLTDLPNFELIHNKLINIGNFAKENMMRLSFHPSHFCVLSSENEVVIKNTIDELNKHSQIMDLMGLDKTTYYPINIHVGSTKPNLVESSNRFCDQFNNLIDSCKKRLVVENDDKVNGFSTKLLYDLVFQKIGIPITHDFHHHNYGPKDISQEDALKLAISTWKTQPMTHMSSSKKIEELSSKETAHSDYIYEPINNYGLSFDTELECKMKDIALLKYREDFIK